MKRQSYILILGIAVFGCINLQSCNNDSERMELFSSFTDGEKAVRSVAETYSMDEVIAFAANYVTVVNNESYKLNLSKEEALENNITIDQYTELISIVENINVQLAQVKENLPQGKKLIISDPQKRTKSSRRVRNLESENLKVCILLDRVNLNSLLMYPVINQKSYLHQTQDVLVD